MGLHLYSVHHAAHGLDAVQRVAPAVPELARRLVERHDDVRGAVVLATCNRVEIYLDAEPPSPGALTMAVRLALAEGCADEVCPTHLPLAEQHATEVLWHLFHVGAGLDSMVVGEREIAGQLKRALKVARREGTTTHLLTESIEQALRTSRRVQHLTNLAGTGRSVVAVGLDLLERSWPETKVLLLGTGAYAGAVAAALASRGCTDVRVASGSGRAEAFARSHGLVAAEGPLADELLDADVVVTCRGVGPKVLTVDLVTAALDRRGGRPLDIVDLALTGDTEPAVGDLDGVRLVDLAAVQGQVPDASAREVARAEQMVAEGVDDLVVRLKGRQMDPAVVALRDTITTMVDDEIDRLPVGRPLTHDEAAHALRRLAARLVHEPSVRARKAAEEGRGQDYLAALHEIYGIRAALGEGAEAVDPDTLDTEKCPVVGMDLTDLGERPRREAM